MPKISIVIPIYNVERYLSYCLDSVRKQSFSDFEVIMVDDGSTDQSGKIADIYTKLDARFKVIHGANRGLPAARNRGIDAATGEILMTLDSDDYLKDSAFETVVEVFDESVDVVVFGADCVPSATARQDYVFALSPQAQVFEGFHPDLVFEARTRPFSWRAAARLSFMNERHIRYDEDLDLGEDQVFLFKLYPQARKTIVLPDKLYIYRHARIGSITSNCLQDIEVMVPKHLIVFSKALKSWRELGLLCGNELYFVHWSMFFVFYDALCMEGQPALDAVNSYKAMLLEYIPEASQVMAHESRYAQRILEQLLSQEVTEQSISSMKAEFDKYWLGRKALLKRCLTKPFGRFMHKRWERIEQKEIAAKNSQAAVQTKELESAVDASLVLLVSEAKSQGIVLNL